jgi:serine O-acetyltransferase
VKQDGVSRNRLDHTDVPDPVVDLFTKMQQQIDDLQRQLQKKTDENGGKSAP